MKKIMFLIPMIFVLSLMITGVAVAGPEVESVVVDSFGTSASTYSTTGLLIVNTLKKANVISITASWDIQSSTSTLSFYDTLTSTTAIKKVYEIKIPSGTVSNIHTVSFDTLPMIAKNGLIAVLDNAAHKVSVVIQYW